MKDRMKFWLTKKARDFFGVKSELRTTLAHEKILTKVGNTTRLKILDYGCGEGDLSARLAQAGHEVIGVDISEDSLAEATQRYKDVEGLRFCHTDDLVDTDFDIAILSFVIVTIPTYEKSISSLKTVYQKLKSSGKILFVETHPCFRNFSFSSFQTNFCMENYFLQYRPFQVTVIDTVRENKKSTFSDFHKSLGEICSLITSSGFIIEELLELYDDVDPDMHTSAHSRLRVSVPPYIWIEGVKRVFE
jgi:ubiquinone/menaquinone biosynthesis C-methylase UbiE